MPIKTIQEEWREYRDTIYPQGISGIQNRECHQAFFAGAFATTNLLKALAELPDDQAVAGLDKLKREILEFHMAVVGAMKARN